MTIAKYLRISDEDTDLKSAGKAESNSIANQRNLLDSFISHHTDFAQADIIEFCDDGWSGKNFERPGIQAMLEQVKRGKIQCIIVKDLSRFGRDYLTVGSYISKIFPFMGVRFIAVNDGLDSARPGDVDSLDTSFKALLYDLYSRDLSRKVRSAKRFRAQRGDFVASFAPYGYMKSPENHSHLIIDPPAAEIVRRIFRLVAEGNSTVAVAKMMNDEAVLTPMLYKRAAGCSRTRWPSIREDNFWTDQIITKIVRDKQYLGMNIYGKRIRDVVGSTHTVKVSRDDWVTTPRAHEAIVTVDEFNQAQAALREFQEHTFSRAAYSLAGKIRCGICGHVLRRSYGKDKYYYCLTHKVVSAAECTQVRISETDVLTELLNSLHIQAAIALDRGKLLAEQRERAQNDKKTMLKRLTVLQETVERCNRDSRGLYEAFVLGDIDKSEYLRNKSALSTQKEKLSLQITEIQSVLDSQDESAEDQFVEKFKPYAHSDEISDEVMKGLLKEVQVYPNGRFEIMWNFKTPLFPLD